MMNNTRPVDIKFERNVDGFTSESNDDFQTVESMVESNKLIECYQIQVDESNVCKAVLLGAYPEIPMPVNKIIQYNNYNLHVVTYILSKEEIDNGLYKIVGVNVFKNDKTNSLCSLDLVMDVDTSKYQLIFNDHDKNTTVIVEKLEKFPGVDKVLEYIINKAFEDPLKTLLIR
jgi:hypothetical protein